MKILDIGCGNATFWKSIASELPHNLEIHLVDYSEGMLESARKNVADILSQYPEKNLSFVIDKRDASDFNYPISSFDRIMANHVLFYLSKESRRHLYLKISNMLAEGGQFSCSLVGEHHMEEIHRLFHQQYPSLVFPADKFDILLETAPTELSSYFDVQESVEQENDLLVPDEHLVLQYVESFSQEIKEVIHADKEHFLHQMRQLKNGDGYLYIHKSTGNIICTKRQ